MGLDMYLHKKTYIGAKWEHRNVKGTVYLTMGGKELPIRLERISTIDEEVGYWRKANHIHKWFVENVQDGKDDCGEYCVSVEQLKKLLDDCKAVLEKKDKRGAKKTAKEVLPTQEGFFFGSTDYDEGYWQDIQDTIEILEVVINEELQGRTGGDYYYHSSW